METAELEMEVSELLLTASTFSAWPTAGMAYCRKATECISHNLHYRQYGRYPEFDDAGNFPSLAGIINQVKDSLERQTSEVLFSINAQSRGGLHWDFESRGQSAKKHHVEVVIDQIANTFTDLYGVDLSLSERRIDDSNLEKTVKRILLDEIREAGLSNEEVPSKGDVDEDDLNLILEIADSASEIGIEFDYGEENKLGNAAELSGRWDAAEGHYRQALQGYRESGDKKGESISLNNLGWIQVLKGSTDDAELRINESLVISKAIEYRDGEANSLNLLGNIEEDRGDLERAESLFKESMELFRRTGNRRRQAAVSNNLGVVSNAGGNYEQALGYFRDGNAISKEVGDKRIEALTSDALGKMEMKRGNLERAEEMFRQSLVIDRSLGDLRGEGDSLTYLSELEVLRGEIGEAASLLERVLEIDRKIGDRFGEVQTVYNLGVYAFEQGHYKEAEGRFRESIRISNEIGCSVNEWLVENGYSDPESIWDFPPANAKQELKPEISDSWR
jgi:tetratricopeptide (TPR) repeat protein